MRKVVVRDMLLKRPCESYEVNASSSRSSSENDFQVSTNEIHQSEPGFHDRYIFVRLRVETLPEPYLSTVLTFEKSETGSG